MDFIFNEFSFRNGFMDVYTSRVGMGNLLKVCKHGRELGISRLAIRPDFYEQFLTKGYRIIDWLSDQVVSKVLKDLLLSIVRYPYIDENDTAVEDRYILSNSFIIEDEMSRTEGLAIAYLYNTLSISLCSSEKWNVNEIAIKFVEEGYDDQIVRVKHASQVEHIVVHRDWIILQIGIKLQTTDLPSCRKRIHLSGDHHGNDLLLRFSRKLTRSPYITEIINSLPFNRHDSEFIKECYEDGKIEIVLVRTDEGFGLVVQTTGKSVIETQAIAKILLEEFEDEY